jgi:DNA-binding NtrC family response regulator
VFNYTIMGASTFKKILLADDDDDDRKLFEEALCEVLPGCSLMLIPNGEYLEEIILQEKPDAVFIDIYMPIKSGHECIKCIRDIKSLQTLIVIAYSSCCHQSEVNISYGFGAHLYMRKPDHYNQLVEDLGRLFRLDWNDPEKITRSHYKNSQFYPFNG